MNSHDIFFGYEEDLKRPPGYETGEWSSLGQIACTLPVAGAVQAICVQRSKKSRESASPMIFSGTANRAAETIVGNLAVRRISSPASATEKDHDSKDIISQN